jgi:predicted membrane channel-forming protein YqfA (hemolysin III family)
VKLGDAVKYARLIKADHAKKFAQHMVPAVVRPAQILWNKALGAVFGVMALIAFHYAYIHADNPAAMLMAGFFGAVMFIFCVSSFLRVRRLSRL